jgi:hypothetical protein
VGTNGQKKKNPLCSSLRITKISEYTHTRNHETSTWYFVTIIDIWYLINLIPGAWYLIPST